MQAITEIPRCADCDHSEDEQDTLLGDQRAELEGHGRSLRLRRARLGGGMIFAGALLAVALFEVTCRIETSRRPTAAGSSPAELTMLQDHGAKLQCHTARKGEQCHTDVVWAMKKWKQHPEWYVNITSNSTFEEFQNFFHQQVENDGTRRCPKPCGLKAHPKTTALKQKQAGCSTAAPGDECYNHVIYTKKAATKYPEWYSGLDKGSSLEDVQHYLAQEKVCPEPCDAKANKTNTIGTNETECHTARPGETCFSDILFAKTKYIHEHPDWYIGSGLINTSSNDEFQAYLHNLKHVDEEAAKKQCPNPCNKEAVDEAKLYTTCQTAVKGEEDDECYDSVVWGATVGIHEHPEWYTGLSPKSSFEQFQLHIYTGPKPRCRKPPCPCHTAVEGEPCHSSVVWVMKKGIHEHPKAFRGLTHASSFGEVQAHLHAERITPCPRPCVSTPW